ncbi:hypothetical protein LENED_012142 [Lentinula edodes]|uniref:Uncharacterized protein n=1 Tax=Lentinula edodes TaxID=5353 RepID=A0A1Q3ERU9_LENED|nr:hypothetical protein LENED_012142 [Lentinula edodes]
MLDKQDEVDADQQEPQKFLVLQQDEASVAAKQKHARSPLPVVGPSTKKVRSEGPKKHFCRKSPVVEVASMPSCLVRLVVPPGQLSVITTTTPVPLRALPSPMEVTVRDDPVQGSSDLVQLETIAEAHSGLACPVASPPAPQMPIKGGELDILTSNMPPTPRSTLVPHILTAHPYHTENQCLVAQVQLFESQLADSQRENSSLTTALRDTSHALEARQWEVEQLRTSSWPSRGHLVNLVLEHSRFDNNGPFLTASQHASFTAPPPNSLEPPLHRHIDDQLTQDWEQLMLQYMHHITDTLLSAPDMPVPMSVEPGVESSDVVVEQSLEETGHPSSIGSSLQVLLFLPEQESPTSPSPGVPPLFGSVAPLAIDLTGNDNKLYVMECHALATTRCHTSYPPPVCPLPPPQVPADPPPSIPDATTQTSFPPTRIRNPS